MTAIERLRALLDERGVEWTRTESLLRILRDEWRIDAGWDGLRHFWYVGLTDEGVRERDEFEAENERLRDCLTASEEEAKVVLAENAKLRELVRDMYGYAVNREMELCNACTEADGDYSDCAACDEYDGACGIAKKRFEELYTYRMRELGVEVDA